MCNTLPEGFRRLITCHETLFQASRGPSETGDYNGVGMEKCMELPPWAESDNFSARVIADLRSIVSKLLPLDIEQPLHSITKIFILSSRLDRYFDRSIRVTAHAIISELLVGCETSKPLPPIEVTDRLESAEDNSLYIVCIHLNRDDLDFCQVIRSCTNSLVIGWFWDSHHNYKFNAEIAQQLHICIPAHHHGAEMLRHSNTCTTYPMPLACSQWTSRRLSALIETEQAVQRDYALKAAFSDWEAAPERSDIIEYYNAISEESDIRRFAMLLVCTKDDQISYFQLSDEDKFRDWLSAIATLVLPVRGDLSMRFFDSLACGCIPIVDSDVAREALQDLAPGLREQNDYIVVDSRRPSELGSAISKAILLSNSRKLLPLSKAKSSRRVLESHLVEHRLALIILGLADLWQDGLLP